VTNVNQQWDLTRVDDQVIDTPAVTVDALFLQHTDSGLYYTLNSSAQLVRSASSLSDAQGFEKVSNGSGFSLRAAGGDYDGLYSYEPKGENRQVLTADLADAEVFFENSCGDGTVFFTSGETG